MTLAKFLKLLSPETYYVVVDCNGSVLSDKSHAGDMLGGRFISLLMIKDNVLHITITD